MSHSPVSLMVDIQTCCEGSKLSQGLRAHLSHGSQESLRVEESRHPEDVGATAKTPGVELTVAVNQLGEPESQCAGVP